jgi:hypothetical protein
MPTAGLSNPTVAPRIKVIVGLPAAAYRAKKLYAPLIFEKDNPHMIFKRNRHLILPVVMALYIEFYNFNLKICAPL